MQITISYPQLGRMGRQEDQGVYVKRDMQTELKKQNYILSETQTPMSLSVVIPTYNEKANVNDLVSRLRETLAGANLSYELVFIDDRSEDGTYEYIRGMAREIPEIRCFRKKGKQGKAYSLLEGFQRSQYGVIAMIDADLQYPPEAIADMVQLLSEYDIVVANRRIQRVSLSRRLMTKMYRFVLGRVMLGISEDVQSGLKVFRKEVLESTRLSPSGWGFDYEFLFKAKRLGMRLGGYDIEFEKRARGKSKVNSLAVGMELLMGTVMLRAKYFVYDALRFLEYPHASEARRTTFSNPPEDFLYRPEIQSIRKHIYWETMSLAFVGIGTAAFTIWALWYLFAVSPFIAISGAVALFYLLLMVFKLAVSYRSLEKPFLTFSEKQVAAIKDDDLPVYTVLVPLYQEAEMIPQIVRALSALDYPKDKLEIVITLEEYDHETMEAIKRSNMPKHFRTVVLPDVKPKTKPKALNVAFPQTRGDMVVIYDAEVIPDPDQLKKAYLAFKKYPRLGCVQTRLDHYNADQGIITRLFNAEFTFYYDLFLPGLQKFGLPIPLSGHSTHFKREVIEKIGCWDPYNVAEDCDVGIRLQRAGYRVDIIDSMSKEEATADFSSWVRQRSRWMKGFLQTSIVHLRHPLRFKDEVGGWKNFGGFLLTVPGTVIINFFNLFYWMFLAAWFLFQPSWIHEFFPGPILYISVFSFITGNIIFTYLNLLASFRREKYSLVKYSLLSPLYWFMLAYATTKAVVQIVTKPHHWEKTKHGTHLKPVEPEYVQESVPA